MSRAPQQGEDRPAMLDLIRELYPICRSITGDGVRETFDILGDSLPLDTHEVPTGTSVFDWNVPKEWNVREAYIETMAGERVLDFSDHNLHLLNYSRPTDTTIGRAELDAHLHSMPEHPDWIPYRTSYYTEDWGFCLTQRQRDTLREPRYKVKIDTELKVGSLSYAECWVPGRSKREVLLFTHVCHPSLCNDNLSGIAVLSKLGQLLLEQPSRRFSYRLVFAPGTIGSITWLSKNQSNLPRIEHGLVLGLLGDDAPHTFKKTRSGKAEVDRIASYVLRQRSDRNRILDFSPYGYDERQFGSPGINLPVGRLTRSVNGGYPQYHSSADNLDIVSEQRLQESVDVAMEILDSLEENRYYQNLEPYCEPQLGKRGMYRATGGTQLAERETAMLWLLNQADGETSLLDIAEKSGLSLHALATVADELKTASLIAETAESQREAP
ncbi:MAG: DUF4910 domain-containing protein [Pseudomonadales bacterium]